MRLNKLSAKFLENIRPCQPRDWWLALAVFAIATLALGAFSTNAVNNGDSAVYLQQMQDLDFAHRTVHIAYYILGAGFIRLVPGPDDHVINLMNCLLGGICVASVFLITRMLCKHLLPAIAAAAFLLTHHMFFMNSVYAEVYTPQLAFFLVAFWLWLLDRPLLAGLAFAISLLITPTAVFALPLFVITRPRLRSLMFFAATAFLLSAVAITPIYQDFFYSNRGLLKARGAKVNLPWALATEGRQVLENFLLCIPFIVIGVFTMFSRRKFLPLGLGLLTLWLATLCFGERFRGVPVQLPLYALLCMVAGLAIQWLIDAAQSHNLLRWAPWPILILLGAAAIIIKTTGAANQNFAPLPTWLVIAITACALLLPLIASLAICRNRTTLKPIIAAILLVLAGNGFTTTSKIIQTNQKYATYRDAVLQIPKIADSAHLVIGDWCYGTRYAHYLSQNNHTPDWLNYEWLFGWWGKEKAQEAKQKLNNALSQKRQIGILRDNSNVFNLLQRSGYQVTRFHSIYKAIPATPTSGKQ